MIDKKWIGHVLPTSEMVLDHSRLRFFAKAIGETAPEYIDTKAAQAAGYADLPVPPTFLFGAELDSGATDTLLTLLSIPIARLLHGEQSFTFHRTACAGETVTVQSVIEDIYDKKNGALEFVVKTSRASNQRNEAVADMRTVLVVRN